MKNVLGIAMFLSEAVALVAAIALLAIGASTRNEAVTSASTYVFAFVLGGAYMFLSIFLISRRY